MTKQCQACKKPSRPGTRRFRCNRCQGLFCVRCVIVGGQGNAQGMKRWACCHPCQAAIEKRVVKPA